MKKGENYKSSKHKRKTNVYSGYTVTTILYIVLALVSFVGLILNIVILAKFGGDEKDKIQDIGNIVISGVAFLISLRGTISELKKIHSNYFGRQILHQKEYENNVRKAVSGNIGKTHLDSGYKWKSYKEQKYLTSDRVNERLASNAGDLRIKVNPKKHHMGDEQKELLYNIVDEKINSGKSIFNSNLVRLRTDILEELFECKKEEAENKFFDSFGKKAVLLEKTDYFSNLSTNDQIYGRFFKYDYSSVYCAKNMSVDADDVLYDLPLSPAANIVGVTTLAITRDGYLLINRQNNNNDVNNDCYVPSGSGSSDFADIRKSRKFEPENLRRDVQNFLRENKCKKFLKTRRQYLKQLDNNSEDTNCKKDYGTKLKQKKENKLMKRYKRKMHKYTYSFNTFLAYGMVRELVEESHIYDEKGENDFKKISRKTRQNLIDNTLVCGYIRILDRGGKPDFFGFTFLENIGKAEAEKMFGYGRRKVTAKEVKKRCPITDFNEVCEQKYIYIDNVLKYATVDEMIKGEFHTNDKKEPKISLQLHCLFELLLKNKDEITKRVAAMQNNK